MNNKGKIAIASSVFFLFAISSLFFFLNSPSSFYRSLVWRGFHKDSGDNNLPSPLRFIAYTLCEGDNLWDLARKTGLLIDSIVSVNSLKDVHVIRVGEVIYLPTSDGIKVALSSNVSDPIGELTHQYQVPSRRIVFYNRNLRENPVGFDDRTYFLPGISYSPLERAERLGSVFQSPIPVARITSLWGYRIHPITKKRSFHEGIDLGGTEGIPIHAAMGGVISFADSIYHYGKMVEIKHRRNYTTRYAHLNKIYVKPGQRVYTRQIIGELGQTGRVTGPHLHFEIRKNGKSINPRRLTHFKK